MRWREILAQARSLGERPLADIWLGEPWQRFRETLHERCDLCPFNRHIAIPLRPATKIGALSMMLCYDTLHSRKMNLLTTLRARLRETNRT